MGRKWRRGRPWSRGPETAPWPRASSANSARERCPLKSPLASPQRFTNCSGKAKHRPAVRRPGKYGEHLQPVGASLLHAGQAADRPTYLSTLRSATTNAMPITISSTSHCRAPSPGIRFDYGNSHFVVLDSNRESEEQLAWLVEDLEASKATWKFVSFHHPPFTAGGNYYSEHRIHLKNLLHPIFEKYGVDVVFNGHDHKLRTYTPDPQQAR